MFVCPALSRCMTLRFRRDRLSSLHKTAFVVGPIEEINIEMKTAMGDSPRESNAGSERKIEREGEGGNGAKA